MAIVQWVSYGILLFLFFGTVSEGTLSKTLKRRKRAEDQSPPIASEMFQSPNNMFNSAYFLGQCLMCPPGPQGPPGQDGTRGLPGRDGRDALLVGYPSTDGSRPASRPPPYWSNDDRNFTDVPAGATYTRWGRPSCPEYAELIYTGVMAGSHYTHTGGASDYLCLSKDPIFDRPTAGHQFNTYLYGTEYETGSSNLFPNLQDYEVPCAVCLAPSKSLTLMIPGRNECPLGPEGRDWNLEYKGIIMSQHHTHPRTQHVCVDSEAEGVHRSHGDHNGALLYIVEVACVTGGGLPCPPYTEGYEVTCAVCSL